MSLFHDQRSPVQPNPEKTPGKIWKFSKNNVFFFKKSEKRKEEKKCWKKCYYLSFLILVGRNSTRDLQSTPFQNPGGVPQVWQSPKDEGIFVYNFGCIFRLGSFPRSKIGSKSSFLTQYYIITKLNFLGEFSLILKKV